MALKLSVIGTGYLGATHAACMASLGFEVIGFDTEASKIDLLSKGKVPFYEPELEELLSDQIKSGRLTFTNNVAVPTGTVDLPTTKPPGFTCFAIDSNAEFT